MIIVYDLFNTLFNLVCQYFVGGFCIYVYQWYWLIISPFLGNIFVWFWYQSAQSHQFYSKWYYKPCHSSQTRKGIRIGKEVKLSLLADAVILYIKNPKDSTINPLECFHEFRDIAEYKINIQKYVAFLYTKNELSEREINMERSLMFLDKKAV